MRRVLIALAILVAFIIAILATWIFLGRQLSLLVDSFATIEIGSVPIHSITYEGSGTGGWLMVNDVHLSLNETNLKIALSIGSTKDNQFALATGGKVFAFGPISSTTQNAAYDLAAVPQAGDHAALVMRRSALSWPNVFDFNLTTGQSPSWKRHM